MLFSHFSNMTTWNAFYLCSVLFQLTATPIVSNVPVSVPTAAPILILTTPKPEPTRLLLRMVGHLRRPPIDGLSGGWMNYLPSIIMPLGLCQTNGVGLDVRMKCCVKKNSNGITVSAVRYCIVCTTIPESNQIKSNQISDYKPTEQIRHRAD